MVKKVMVRDKIALDQFLKWCRVASTGGQGKYYILNDMVQVNGVIENRRSRKLQNGDLVEVKNTGSFLVVSQMEDT